MPAKKKAVMPKSITEAKLSVWSAIGTVEHDAKQGHRNYTYTSHEAVTAAVVPAMYNAGITARFKCDGLTIMDNFALFKCTGKFFHHDSGEEEKCSVYAGDRLRDGTTMGAIMSYAVKVIYVKYFGLSTGEKDLEQIQAEQEAVNHTMMQQKGMEELEAKRKAEAEKASEEEGPWEAEEVAEEFDGTVCCTDEQQLEFYELCGQFGLGQTAIKERFEHEGYANIQEVPEYLMVQWIDSMKEKLENAKD